MSTTISGDTGITFPDASTQSKAVSQATPFAVTASAIAGAELQLPEATDNGVNYVAVKAPNTLAANTTFTLPAADGTSGQVLQTNASGSLSFGNVAAANGGTGLTSPGTAGNVLTSDGTGWTSAAAASGSLLRVTVFTASGTWTKGAGTNFILVSGVGGGASGGGPRASTTAGAGGGGAGGYFKKLASSSGISTASVTIGSGGAAQATDGTAGNNGGNTTFVYGATTLTGNGGVGGAANIGGGGGGNGGTATNGDLNIRGQAGMGGNYPAGTNGLPGTGGSSMLGFGGPSNAAQGVLAATGFGAGGTGASGASTGGAGTSGIIIVEEYA